MSGKFTPNKRGYRMQGVSPFGGALFYALRKIMEGKLMKKLGILLLAAAFAVFGLFSFAACNEETLGPGDDPIVTPGPDDPGKPEEPGEPTPPEEEPEATEGLVFELLTTENSDGFEEFLGADFEDCYVCTGLTVAEENVAIPSTYNGLSVRMVQWYDLEPEIANGIISFYIPDSVQIISLMSAYYSGYENLTEIRLPRNPNAMISGSSFWNCAFYNDPNNWDNGALYMDDWLLATNDDLPEEYTVKQGTVGIASGAFSRSSVKKVTVPDSVQALYGSFASCVSLEEVVLPDSLSSIGYCTFLGCFSLESITIPDSVTFIGESSFLGCSSLTSVTIPDGVIAISWEAFMNCIGLKSIVIPDSVIYISCYAFAGCESLKGVTIGDGGTFIDEYAFAECESLKSVTIGGGGTSIERHAFDGCVNLENITICDGVTFIGEYVFARCDSLTSIIIPDSVTTIGEGAFYECISLTSVTIPDSVTSIGGYAFSDCNNLTSITIPDSVAYIGWGAFSGCKSLTSIAIPDNVTSIKEETFMDCSSLTSIVIPSSITFIGWDAFSGCKSLTSVVFEEPEGWSVGGESIDAEALSDPATASEYLTNRYLNSLWQRH